DPANAQLIAQVPGWSNPRQWTKYPEQQSLPISLIQGRKYYIFALQKEGTGLDNLAVGWQLPDNTLERPVSASYFSVPSTSECNWVLSANEGQQVTFTGTKTVRYGANGQYAFGTFTDGTPCNNATFGDPAPGLVKQCWICETDPVVESLALNNTSVSAGFNGTTESITVTANIAWTVTSDQNWVTFNPDQGNGDGSFDIIVAANTSGVARNATVTVAGGSITQTVAVSQEANPVSTGDCFVENQGEVVMEAESYTRKLDGANRSWTLFSRNDASGGQAMEVNGTGVNTDQSTNGPRMDYDITFSTPGTYYVWALTAAQNGGGANNSVHLGLDQSCFTCTGGNGVGRSNSSFTWIDDIESGTNNITINIPAPGTYTFNVWMREDGVQIDKILLRQSTADPSGLGPNESAKGDCVEETIPDGTGLTGTYFNNADLTNPVLTRLDPQIDFDWVEGSPDPAIDPNTFSVRWEGEIQARFSETYTFFTTTDDGVRLWVNDQLIIDNWVDQSVTETSGNIDLLAGQKVKIRMEFYENSIFAVARLAWSSASQNKQIVPQAYLFPAPVTPIANIIGEVGTLALNPNWQTVNLNNTYNNPVVVTGALTFNGGEPAMARVRNVTANSFEVRLEEWFCQDGNHASETLNYMVIEAGVHTLSNGKKLMAGNLASIGTGWTIEEFPEDFNEEPVIIAQCVSVNDPLAVITRIRHQETNAEQFQVKIQGPEGNSSHGAEQLAWIAAEAGVTADNLPFEVINYGRVSDERWKTATFSQSYVNPPVMVAELSSHHGGNPINLR
ncbi:MAG: PA14 domain-containing protein, partial [Bacteroidota bacterium]